MRENAQILRLRLQKVGNNDGCGKSSLSYGASCGIFISVIEPNWCRGTG
ncbi:hypothetical protein HMPREF3293_00262 [Christensenella minuta]|uniref:Uncharacterized protein n=1 Tax=Christensenella minuta TaxID=626937 RepID=A0A136Q8G1_9FIRM|nr:hypothetical protein HMPREF3293_00262 [Christensenella minuta]